MRDARLRARLAQGVGFGIGTSPTRLPRS